MKFVLGGVLIAIVAVIGIQIYQLYVQRADISSRVEKLSGQIEGIEKENSLLEQDLEYFASSENLLKEVKELFNYREPGEKLMIIVPKK